MSLLNSPKLSVTGWILLLDFTSFTIPKISLWFSLCIISKSMSLLNVACPLAWLPNKAIKCAFPFSFEIALSKTVHVCCRTASFLYFVFSILKMSKMEAAKGLSVLNLNSLSFLLFPLLLSSQAPCE